MGITEINETIKKYVITNFIESAKQNGYHIDEYIFHKGVPLDQIRGMTVAFDASNIMYAKMSTAHNNIVENSIISEYNRETLVENTMAGILSFFALIFKSGITPVVIFDGKLHPYKEAEVKRRSEIKKIKQEKVDLATQLYYSKNPLEVTKEDEDNLRKSLRNNIKIQKTDYITMRMMLEDLGIFCYEAEYDGEQLCSRLCVEGIVDAVFSTDTDNYAHGCKFLITDIYHGGQGITLFNYVSLPEMLIGLSQYTGRHFTQEELIDLCILHGCDYNERTVLPVKNFNIMAPNYKSCGGKGALDFISRFGRFENTPEYYYPCFGILNVHQCREIFFYCETEIKRNNIDVRIDWNKHISTREAVFNRYNFSGYLRRYWSDVISPTSFKIKPIV